MYFNKYRKDSKKKISNKKPKNHLNILFKQSQKKIIPHPISQIEKNNKEYNKDFNNLNKNTKPNSKNCEEKNINDNDLLLKYTLKILDLGFQKPWMIYYKDEECKYSQETSDEIQKGTYDVFHPQEKKAHEY